MISSAESFVCSRVYTLRRTCVGIVFYCRWSSDFDVNCLRVVTQSFPLSWICDYLGLTAFTEQCFSLSQIYFVITIVY